MRGIVYLIGAGPGDPGLITVRGQQLLRQSDAIIYDHLIPDELVVTLPMSTEKHYVGKQAGKHTMSQEAINQLMVQLALAGKTVARLKGGDPFIFGRGGEEAAYLKKRGIKFEVVPGITSGIAAPAYSGIPCTDRRKASFVIFATGHKAGEKDIDGIPWNSPAEVKGGTLVLYMGVQEIANTVANLIASGLSPETPAAIIQRGTYPTQEIFSGSLRKLPDLVREHQIKPPVIFIIGEVVELQPAVNWFENKPLLGIRVMVTRAAAQAQGLYRDLRDLGAEVLPYPTIATVENDDPEGWRLFSCIATGYRWLVFTSENGVRYFVKQYLERYGDIRRLSEFRIAAIGAGTNGVLQGMMLRPDFVASVATVARFTEEFARSAGLDDATVVRVRGNLADDTMEKHLRQVGVECVPLTVYRTFNPDWPIGLKEKLFDYPPDAIIFTSSSTVDGLFSNLSATEVKRLMKECVVASIGPTTSRKLLSMGLSVNVEAKTHTIPALVDSLIRYFNADDRNSSGGFPQPTIP